MKYVTRQGDMFDAIAKERLGSERYMERLINANREYVAVVEFDAGIELELPEIEEERKVSSLPPWRK